MTVRRSSSSCLLVRCGRTRFAFCSCCQVIPAPDDEEFLLAHHGLKEMMAGGEFLRDLPRRVDRRIDGPEEFALGGLERRGQLREPGAPDDHEVDVAGRTLL